MGLGHQVFAVQIDDASVSLWNSGRTFTMVYGTANGSVDLYGELPGVHYLDILLWFPAQLPFPADRQTVLGHVQEALRRQGWRADITDELNAPPPDEFAQGAMGMQMLADRRPAAVEALFRSQRTGELWEAVRHEEPGGPSVRWSRLTREYAGQKYGLDLP